MTLKTYLYLGLIGLILIVLSYSAGKYMAKSVSIKTEVKDTKVIDVHIVKTETETKKKDGTTTIVTTTDTVQSTKDVQTTNIDKSIVTNSSPKWNVSGMVGEKLSNISLTPIYGVSVQHQFVGPISLGMFGFTNGLLGVSIGVNF